jgi:biopolymer transport protein ExbB/TolQ
MWGLLGTMLGITHAFDQAKDANADPSELAHGVDWSLQSTLAGYLAVPVGLAMAIVCMVMLVRLRRAGRQRSEIQGDTQ